MNDSALLSASPMLADTALPSSWQKELQAEFAKPYFQQLQQFLQQEQQQRQTCFPAQEQIFTAFQLTPLQQVKVVILGQDPYHGAGQAHGLAFSVLPGVAVPPSLQNIFKEQRNDLSIAQPACGDLSLWARQGVLLLNTVLTVRAGQAHSHRRQGWETFTDRVIKILNNTCQGLIFVLWGGPAKAKSVLIDEGKHRVLTAAHPSPLSAHRGFFGCRHFSKINELLLQQQQAPINWQLKN